MTRELQLLLSGPGLIGRNHARLIRELPGVRLAAVIAPRSDEHLAFADEEGAQFFTRIEDAIDELRLDGAIVSSPNEVHFEQAMRCIEARIPALVEKPLTNSIESAAELADAAEKAGVPILVGHHRTYSPILGVAKAFLESPSFGTPVCVQGSALFFKPTSYFEAGPWRTKKGGGPILINLIHEVGLLRYLNGEVESVMARTSNALRSFEVEESAAVTLCFKNGSLGTFVLSDIAASNKSWEMTAGENPTFPFFPDQHCYHFGGTVGSLDFPSMHYRTYASADDRSWWNKFEEGRLPLERRNPLQAQLEHFAAVIRGEAIPAVTARDGYTNMAVLEAIVRSASSRREVLISEVLG